MTEKKDIVVENESGIEEQEESTINPEEANGAASEEEGTKSPAHTEADGEDRSEQGEGGEAEEGADEADLFLSPEDSEGEVIDVVAETSEKVETLETDLAAARAEHAAAVAENERLRGELETSKEELETVTAERDDVKNRMLRVAADLENYRRRTQREMEDLRKYGVDKFASDLLPVVDNLERALQHAESTAESTSIVDGVRMVYRQLLSSLEKFGVKGFESKGEQFDPQKHEAIQQVETPDHATGEIVEQYQKGYYLHDRLLRPALVSVAKHIETSQTETNSEASDEGNGAELAPSPEEVETSNGAVEDGEAQDSPQATD